MARKRPAYKMPYLYFPDENSKQWKRKGWKNIDLWIKGNTTTCYGEDLFVPAHAAKSVEEHIGSPYADGLLGEETPFHRAAEIEGKFLGHPAFIFCPGPSLKEVDLGAFSGRLTIAVNSSGFAFDPYFWVMAEAMYVSWFYDQTFSKESVFLWNSRSAFRYICFFAEHMHGTETKKYTGVLSRNDERRRKKETEKRRKRPVNWPEIGDRFKAAFIHRWEEERVMPPRTSAPSITAALVGAWKLGCDSAYVVGMDLSKPEGASYAKDLPHTAKGRKGIFDYQLKALRQFHIPGFKVFNGSPHSQKQGLPFEPISYPEIEDLAIKSESVPPVEEFIVA